MEDERKVTMLRETVLFLLVVIFMFVAVGVAATYLFQRQAVLHGHAEMVDGQFKWRPKGD